MSLLQPLDTAVNGPFKKLIQKEADIYIEELETKGASRFRDAVWGQV
jgi:hypothetical protein